MTEVNREKLDFDLDISNLLDELENDSFFSVDDEHDQPREGKKYVVFYLDEKLYAVDSETVAEAIGYLPVTPLPFVPDWLTGIANLRGDIIPVADLRKLWKKPATDSAKGKFLVLRSEKNWQTAAFVVDKLSEMITLTSSDIEFSAADFESSYPLFFGTARRDDQTVYLLDGEHLFASLELHET